MFQIMLYNQSMEEYRRKYMSPSYQRASSYVETVEKDKTVAELRQELHQCKEMEQKFDDLCLEIVKLERQNKKIQSQQASVESEYIEKIKKNKHTITELKQAVLDCRQNIENRTRKITLLEQANQKLVLEVERLQKEKAQHQQFNQETRETILQKECVRRQKKQNLEVKKKEQKETNIQNQRQSEKLQHQLRDLKQKQSALRDQEQENHELENELASLEKERQLWQKKLIVSESESSELRLEGQANKQRLSQLELECFSLEKQNRKIEQSHSEHKSDIKKLVMENRELANILKDSQKRLSEMNQVLQQQHLGLDRHHVKETELKKEAERLEEVLKQLNETLQEEQESYTRTITHMRQSIQQDEKAIESLVKQASSLETMIA